MAVDLSKKDLLEKIEGKLNLFLTFAKTFHAYTDGVAVLEFYFILKSSNSMWICILVPHRETIVVGEILIFDFLAYKQVSRPQEAKKPVLKESLYLCVFVKLHLGVEN